MLETVRRVADWYFCFPPRAYGPHVYMIYGVEDARQAVIDWDELHACGVDTFLVWDDCYVAKDAPSAGMRYEWKDPAILPLLQNLQRDGGRLLQYVGSARWLSAGGSLYQLLGELDRHGWADGVAMDGTWVYAVLSEIEDFLGILTERMRGPHFLHHSVPDPFFSPENQGGFPARFQPRTITQYFQWVMWGETNPGWPTSLDDPLWRYMISGAHRGYIGIYKPMEKVGNPWEVTAPYNTDWIKRCPDWLITYRCNRKQWEPKDAYAHWPNWRTLFYEAWKAAREVYVRDPEIFIKARFGAPAAAP